MSRDITDMNPRNYDPDKDPTGMIGITLANLIIEHAGGFDRYFSGRNNASDEESSKSRFDYEKFMKLFIENNYIQIGNPFADSKIKRRILRECGYSHLIVNGGKHVPIEEVGDCAIGKVFREKRRIAARKGFG